MKQLVDITNWNRKEIYEHFKSFDDPYCGITMPVDFTRAYDVAKQEGLSFYFFYLHLLLTAVNRNWSMRLRIENDKVYEYDRIDISTVAKRKDGSFGYTYFPYLEDRLSFIEEATRRQKQVEEGEGLFRGFTPDEAFGCVFLSAVPWVSFTDIKLACNLGPNQSTPNFVTGKLYEQDSRKLMPMSIRVHHSLMDGFHISQYVKELEKLIEEI